MVRGVAGIPWGRGSSSKSRAEPATAKPHSGWSSFTPFHDALLLAPEGHNHLSVSAAPFLAAANHLAIAKQASEKTVGRVLFQMSYRPTGSRGPRGTNFEKGQSGARTLFVCRIL